MGNKPTMRGDSRRKSEEEIMRGLGEEKTERLGCMATIPETTIPRNAVLIIHQYYDNTSQEFGLFFLHY
jgi:hypothetical protein